MNLVSIRMAGFINVGSGCCLNLDQSMCLTILWKRSGWPWERWSRGSPWSAPSAGRHRPRGSTGLAAEERGRAAPGQRSQRWPPQHWACPRPPVFLFVSHPACPCLLPGATPCRQCLHWGLPVGVPGWGRWGKSSQIGTWEFQGGFFVVAKMGFCFRLEPHFLCHCFCQRNFPLAKSHLI